MASTALKQIAVYGGGRWARTLVAVLRQVLPEDSEIVWVTQNCFTEVLSSLNLNPVSNLRLVSEWDLAGSSTDAVIVATSPTSHFELVRKAVKLRLPTLCEKPIASSSSQLKDLLSVSEAGQCLVGINLEFLFASYLHDFAERIRPVSVRSIHLDWLDPWSEERDGEIKYGEFYSDIVSDQLPHCWSVLATIRPDSSRLFLTDISYSPECVELQGYFGSSPVYLRLSRRAAMRVRRATVTDDHGIDTVLDFSIEPGSIISSGQEIVNTWSDKRPLACSLNSFVDVVRHRDLRFRWPLELKNCFDAVESSLRAGDMLKAVQDKQIGNLLLDKPLDLANSENVNLIVDRFLPEFAVQGRRFSAHTFCQQKAFASAWLSTVR